MDAQEIKDLTLGADPELILHKDGKVAPANNYFNGQDKFGCDGCSTVAELRPDAAKEPMGLISYIAELIWWGHAEFPDLKMAAGAWKFDYSLGGHIHISTPPSPNKINNLDCFLHNLENHIYPSGEVERRRSGNYGQRKGFKRKNYGIEYRSPLSWLSTPEIALVFITLAKLAVVNDKTNFTEIAEEIGWETMMRNLRDHIPIIPPDCEDGLNELNEVLDIRVETLGDDIIPYWEEVKPEGD